MDHNNMAAGFSHHLPFGQSTRRGSKTITIVGKYLQYMLSVFVNEKFKEILFYSPKCQNVNSIIFIQGNNKVEMCVKRRIKELSGEFLQLQSIS